MSNEDEVEFHRRQRDLLAEQFRSQPVKSVFDAWNKASLDRKELTITPPVDQDYALPEHFQKTVSGPRLRELRTLLGELRALREGLVGLSETEALVLYNGNEQALLLEEKFTGWLIEQVRQRLSRPHPRDRGNPFTTWNRLMDEFGWWSDELICVPGGGHFVALGGLKDRVAWEIYEQTWAPHVHLDLERGELSVDGLPPPAGAVAEQTFVLFGWNMATLCRDAVRATPELADGRAWSTADLVSELALLAADLVEVKSLLIRGFDPERRPIALPNDLLAIWEWEVGHNAGSVQVWRQLPGERQWVGFLRIDLDGRPHEPIVPWLDLGDELLPWTVGLLRPIHAALVDAWLRVERPAEVSVAPADSLGEGEVVAAACEVLAQHDAEGERVSDPKVSRPRVPAVRTITLLTLLERRLGCEVKQGKGSEITVYRPGGRKYTLGGHRRNVHFPAHIVRAMLKAVGISPVEFAAAARIG